MKKTCYLFCVIVLLSFTALQLNAKRVYVKLATDPDNAWSSVVPDANNVVVAMSAGNTAFNSSEVLTNIAVNDEVWVAKGIYANTGALNMNGTLAGVKLYGGFKGDETSLDQRPLFDADGNGTVDPWEFLYVTNFTGSSAGSSFRLLTINATGDVADGFTLSDNKVTATNNAAAAYLTAGAVLNKCIIRNIGTDWANSSAINGGAVQANGGGTISYCLFENCYCNNSNSSAYGGAANVSGTTGSIVNSVIRNCSGTSTNSSGGLGGGLFINLGSKAENCLIYNNYSSYRGGGVYVHNSTDTQANLVRLYNLTVVNNVAVNGGGGAFINRTNADSYNCVAWGNTNGTNPNNFNMNNASFTDALAYNGAEGSGVWLTKNTKTSPANTVLVSTNNPVVQGTDMAPMFTNPTTFAGNTTDPARIAAISAAAWTLKPGSALVNNGINAPDNTANASVAVPFATADFVGTARPAGAKYDLGAYEYINITPSITWVQDLTKLKINDTQVSLTASSSALDFASPITYTSDNLNVVTVTDNVLTIVGVGNAVVTAHQAANTFYNAAGDVAQNVVVDNTTSVNSVGNTIKEWSVIKNGVLLNTAGTIEVTDLTGKMLKKSRVSAGQIIPLASGVYVIRFTSNKVISVRKIVL